MIRELGLCWRGEWVLSASSWNATLYLPIPGTARLTGKNAAKVADLERVSLPVSP
jgi:hypothetical protein